MALSRIVIGPNVLEWRRYLSKEREVFGENLDSCPPQPVNPQDNSWSKNLLLTCCSTT